MRLPILRSQSRLWSLSDQNLYAVCTDTHIYHWDGAAWAQAHTLGGTDFIRIRGTSQCDLWAVGSSAGLATTHP